MDIGIGPIRKTQNHLTTGISMSVYIMSVLLHDLGL